jgi:hypothetical protein
VKNKAEHKFILSLLFVFSLITINLHAQWSDTIRNILHGPIFPTASFDSRNSFVSSERAHIWGIKAGVEFSGKLQIGVGYNFHDKNLQKEIYYSNTSGILDSSLGTLHLSYVSIYTRYVYYKTQHWKFSIMPIQLGIGNSKYKFEQQGIEKETGSRTVILYEPGISVSYKIITWLGVGADIGYRFMLRDNPFIPENFNSMIYSFYAIIYWGEIYKLIFPETKLAKIL